MTAVDEIRDKALAETGLTEEVAKLVKIDAKVEIKPRALYTIHEAATVCSVSYKSLQNAIHAGHLHASYIGAEPRIFGRAIFQWLREGGKTGRSRRNLEEEAERRRR